MYKSVNFQCNISSEQKLLCFILLEVLLAHVWQTKKHFDLSAGDRVLIVSTLKLFQFFLYLPFCLFSLCYTLFSFCFFHVRKKVVGDGWCLDPLPPLTGPVKEIYFSFILIQHAVLQYIEFYRHSGK